MVTASPRPLQCCKEDFLVALDTGIGWPFQCSTQVQGQVFAALFQKYHRNLFLIELIAQIHYFDLESTLDSELKEIFTIAMKDFQSKLLRENWFQINLGRSCRHLKERVNDGQSNTDKLKGS